MDHWAEILPLHTSEHPEICVQVHGIYSSSKVNALHSLRVSMVDSNLQMLGRSEAVHFINSAPALDQKPVDRNDCALLESKPAQPGPQLAALTHNLARNRQPICTAQMLIDGVWAGELFQPYLCRIHHFSKQDARRCLRQKTVVV